MSYINEINSYIPKNEQEAQDKKVILDCIKLFPQTVLLRNDIAHITSSSLILNHTADKMLMIHHNLRNQWTWTGGHADGNQNLLDVAVKEAYEETGVTVKPLSNKIVSIDILPVLGHIRRGVYVNGHLHLSVAYILVADENDIPVTKPDENSAVKWFPVSAISEGIFSDNDIYLYNKLLHQARLFNFSGISE
ncbi:MAG: NUDIX hydrolase [Defluviitaleaceae bacterium]|nr:NUDIX hydrolase [Defluviitaleaceae bacterium]